MLGYVIAQLGRRYDVRHVVELARFFFPVSIVPRRWRGAALTFGSRDGRAVICSSMIAEAFTARRLSDPPAGHARPSALPRRRSGGTA